MKDFTIIHQRMNCTNRTKCFVISKETLKGGCFKQDLFFFDDLDVDLSSCTVSGTK